VKSLFIFLFIDEPFNVLLRTSVPSHRLNNGLRVEKSTSLASPPLATHILSTPPCPVKGKRRSCQAALRGRRFFIGIFLRDGVLIEWGVWMETRDRDGSAGADGDLFL
jgi:hypothetical protein